MGYIGEIKDTTNIVHKIGSTVYGICNTDSSDSNKTATCSGFSLIDGATIPIKFLNGFQDQNITLDINNTGAKSVYYTNTSSSLITLSSNEIVLLIYINGQWNIEHELRKYNPATSSDLGLVKIGTGVTVTTDGTISVTEISSATDSDIDNRAINPAKAITTVNYDYATKIALCSSPSSISWSSSEQQNARTLFGLGSQKFNVTIPSDNWTEPLLVGDRYRRDVIMAEILPNSAHIIAPNGSSIYDWLEFGMVCGGYMTGGLYFTANSVPSSDVYVEILQINI